jgi:hypothetical protein
MTAEIELARPRTASLPEKLEYARFLATSGLLPAQYREKPGNILWAQEYAEMLNLRPMAAITGIHVIEGKPSASAALMSALVRRAGHRLRVSGDDQKAVVEIVRHDDPDFVFRSEWTIDRARKAELTGKGTWKKYPAAMLKARAISECARDACEEALLGMHYTPEELGAEVDAEGEPIRVTAEPVRPADPDWASKPATQHERATGQPEPAGQPQAADEPVDAETVDEPDWEALIAEVERTGNVTPAWKLAREHRPNDMALRERIQQAGQRRRAKPAEQASPVAPVDAEVVEDAPAEKRQHAHMHVLWKKAGVEDREERLAVTSHLVGHDVTSSSQLTYADAELVIERLRSFDAAGTDALKSAVDRWLGEYHAAHTATADDAAEGES